MSDRVTDSDVSLCVCVTADCVIICFLHRSDCLAMDLEKPKPKFVKEVLEKSMRYQNVWCEFEFCHINKVELV